MPPQSSAALTALFALTTGDRLKQLWPQQELTAGWADLLCLPSAILQERVREVQQTVDADRAKLVVPEHSCVVGYHVRLCCPTAEVTHAVAGCIANYALLPREAPDTMQRLRAILVGCTSGLPQSSASSETSSSGPTPPMARVTHISLFPTCGCSAAPTRCFACYAARCLHVQGARRCA